MRVLADGRVRRTRAEWQRVIEKFAASGLSASAFCRRERLSRAAFTRWQQELKGSPRKQGGFVEVPMRVETGPAPVAPGELELSLPGGVCLRWRP